MNSDKIDISVTIVLYKEDEATLQKAIDSFLSISFSKKLFLIDNSPTNKLGDLVKDPQIEYLHLKKKYRFWCGS